MRLKFVRCLLPSFSRSYWKVATHATNKMLTKKVLTNVCLKSLFLFDGIEYAVAAVSFTVKQLVLFPAVILPTLWNYLHVEFGASKFFYGLTLSAFSMATLLTGPLYGLVFDRTHQTKLIVLVANLFVIGGNFMYFAAQSKYMVLASRFCVGIGAGAEPALFGEIARTTTKKERTAAFSIANAFQQFGLILGPGLNLFLRKLDYKIGPFTLNKYTSPGALMTVCWTIIELMFLFFFFKLPTVTDYVKSQYEQHIECSQRQQQKGSENSGNTNNGNDEAKEKLVTSVEEEKSCGDEVSRVSSSLAEQEKTPLLTNDSMKDLSRYSSSHTQSIQKSPEDTEKHSAAEPKGFLQKAYWTLYEFLRHELIYLLAVFFVVVFYQTSIETMIVPMMEELLGWTEFETSLFFCGAGIDPVASFIILMILTRKITDRWLLLFGLSVELLSYVAFIVFVAGADSDTPAIHAKVLIGSGVAVFALPFIFVTNGSLFSKLLPQNIQGFGQGLQWSVGAVAAILGPLWAGATLHMYYVLMGVPLGILAGVMILTLDSFSRLKEHSKISE